MPPTTEESEFDALVRRAGLSLAPAQRADVLAAWRALEPMLASIRRPPPGVAPGSAAAASAEPAVIYRAERGA